MVLQNTYNTRIWGFGILMSVALMIVLVLRDNIVMQFHKVASSLKLESIMDVLQVSFLLTEKIYE